MDVKLVWFKSDGERKDFPLINDLTTIGRREDCDLRIPLSQISRRHCQISKTPQGAFIRDLGSSNGTFVNNQRVQETRLSAGDQLIVGPINFVVQVDGRPAEIPPPPAPTPQVTAMEPMVAPPEGAPSGGDADVDPISALEAMAGDAEDQPPEDPFARKR